MALLTSLARVQAIASTDGFIQGLTGGSPIVSQVFGYVTNHVKEPHFGARTQEAQDYLATHMLSMAGQPNGGRGPLSARTVGGINTAFTLPYLNRKSVLGATQYGNHYIEVRRSITMPFRVITPSGV